MNQTFPGLRLEAVACVVPLYDTTLGAYAERFGKDIAERYRRDSANLFRSTLRRPTAWTKPLSSASSRGTSNGCRR